MYENHRQDLSRSQKFKQRRLGPFTVTKRVTNTTNQIQDDKDPTVFITVHRKHLVEYYLKEETLAPMVEDYVPIDQRHDIYYERFMAQPIQKLNISEQPSMENSLPFAIVLLRTAPVTLTQKRVSNTSSDSGVNSPHVLSPAMPITPDSSQPYLVPSTSQMNPPSGPITPIQHFINNSRKSENNEPKHNRCQPDHPDPQSVRRTRTRQGYKLFVFIFCMIFIPFHSYEFLFSGIYQLLLSFQPFFIPDNHA